MAAPLSHVDSHRALGAGFLAAIASEPLAIGEKGSIVIGERNLAPERGPDVWKRQEATEDRALRSRWMMGLGGAAIALTGAALAAIGGKMVYRAGLPARDAEPDMLGGGPHETSSPAGHRDVVSEESAASFPASDAPSWTPMVGAVSDDISGKG